MSCWNSCFCAPCQAILNYIKPINVPPSTPISVAVVHNVSVASLSSIPEAHTHTRTRTWMVIDGKMRYDLDNERIL